MAKPKILVADSEKMFAVAVSYLLENAGYDVVTEYDSQAILAGVHQLQPNLIVVSSALSAIDGCPLPCLFEQEQGVTAPPLCLVLGDSRQEAVCAEMLDSGADDYIAKPFGMKEFMARINALLRRTNLQNSASLPGELTFGTFSLSLAKLRLRVITEGGARFADLTPREAQIMEQLMRADGAYLSRHELSERIWRDEPVTDRTVGTLDVHLRNLRKKIEKASGQNWHIESKRAVGVRFQAWLVVLLLLNHAVVLRPRTSAFGGLSTARISCKRPRGRRSTWVSAAAVSG